MTLENDFLWIASGAGANVTDQATYAGASTTSLGYGSGVLTSKNLDKSLRQATGFPAMLGAFMNAQGQNAVDDGVVANLLANFTAALANFTQASSAAPGTWRFVDSPVPDAGFLPYDGSSLSRATYSRLFNAYTGALTGSVSNGSPTLAYSGCLFKGVSVTPQAGWYVSGPGITGGSTSITAVSGGNITMSANATAGEPAGTGFVISPYPLGDGVNTFNIGDGRGQFPRGWDNGRGIDPGRSLGGPVQQGMLQSHSHSASDTGHTHLVGQTVNVTPSGTTQVIAQVGTTAYTIVSYANISVAATGGSETRPTNVSGLWCIKY